MCCSGDVDAILSKIPIIGSSVKTKAKFAEAWASFKAIEAATSYGTSYIQFGPLFQKFAADVALIPKNNLSNREKQDLKVFTELVEAYALSLKLWSLKFDSSAHNDHYLWLMKSDGTETFYDSVSLAKHHELKLITNRDQSIIVPADSIPIIWTCARIQANLISSDIAQ